MSTFFYEPFYDIDRLITDVLAPRSQWAGDTGSRELQRASGEGAPRPFKPRMDLHEDAEKNIVTAFFELPGVKKDDVTLDAHNGRLTVTAETKSSEEHEEHGYAIRERRSGKYSRTLQLPQGIKDDDIKAHMENGVLTVTFPKSTPDQAPRRITVG
ncbi:hypothetical protein AGABI1DRAFT_112039 [Agaricus bisporus var. burnettii JB137-S8]|uniref:Uncharacterized protein n=1 Tax=Agaricus bisporus var. burnettii (strain JB137-S8 / ATCC MYA-4627 / FGSC 10392) TaxID=597362 RepID=K5XEI8_AGABU|nr:uncharacterized protein AGABI1DRAFT_112039 [Agaricus bisporus var. burnettii JB137-S8]EKM81793.1 hypothetical protein AGABI1DRAFT_112039 [Agaricus bisporus var. burnettii JB137-S8]